MAVIHARLGDGNMAGWGRLNDTEAVARKVALKRSNHWTGGGSIFRKTAFNNPRAAFACYRALGRELPRVIVTDSKAAAQCSVRQGIAVTAGDAVHLGFGDAVNAAESDKLMLDWWLLARAAQMGQVGCSTYSKTARLRFGSNLTEAMREFKEGCADLLDAGESDEQPCTAEELAVLNRSDLSSGH
eukprot:1946331-Prymnesium_polylepis.1